MSLRRRPNRPTIHTHRARLEGGADGTGSSTHDIVGPYDLLLRQYNALVRNSDRATLSPTQAGEGRLTIRREISLGEMGDTGGSVEVEWIELRKKIETHPRYNDLTDDDLRTIRAAVADPEAGQPESLGEAGKELALELYKKLLRGQTEYSIGAPVARRTTPMRRDDLSAGATWFLQDPPFQHPSGYQWMKTLDTRRRTGRAYERIEEWTGAEEWDPDIYTTGGGGGGD